MNNFEIEEITLKMPFLADFDLMTKTLKFCRMWYISVDFYYNASKYGLTLLEQALLTFTQYPNKYSFITKQSFLSQKKLKFYSN